MHSIAKNPLSPPGSLRRPNDGAAGEAVSTWRPRLLIADDNPLDRQLMAAFAEAQGWSTTIVVDGGIALDVASTMDFDALVFDLDMPSMSGLRALAELRENDALNAATPAMIWTAGDVQAARRGAQVLADVTVVGKPLCYRDFVRWIESLR